MKREFEKEEWKTTFTVIKDFDEMLRTPTRDIFYTENDGFGVICYNGATSVTRHKTLIHKHPYYNLHNMAMDPQKINRDNFHGSGFTFYKRVSKVKFGSVWYAADEFVEKVYFGKKKNRK